MKNMNLTKITQIGHWAFLAGIALAILASFTAVSFLPIVLFILGLIVGFLNIKEKDGSRFLISVIALLLIGIGAAGLEFGKLSPIAASILNNFIAFVSAAGLVVAIKQILAAGQQGE